MQNISAIKRDRKKIFQITFTNIELEFWGWLSYPHPLHHPSCYTHTSYPCSLPPHPLLHLSCYTYTSYKFSFHRREKLLGGCFESHWNKRVMRDEVRWRVYLFHYFKIYFINKYFINKYSKIKAMRDIPLPMPRIKKASKIKKSI